MLDAADNLDQRSERYFPLAMKLLRESLPIASYSGKEGEQAETLARFFREEGLPVAFTPRGSVIALGCLPSPDSGNGFTGITGLRAQVEAARRSGRAILAYNAHLDIVDPGDPSAWKHAPFAFHEEGGRIYGRGACDMKGAMATMAAAMVGMAHGPEARPELPLVMGCFVTEEECAEGLALEEVIVDLGLKPDFVLLGEPSSLAIALGQRGKCEFRVETSGILAHTSMPEVGHNALYDLTRIARAVEELDRREFARLGNDPARLLERNTLVMTAARSIPFLRNSVPASAEAFVTARLARGASFESLLRELREHPDWPVCQVAPLMYEGSSWTGKPAAWIIDHRAWNTAPDHPWTSILRAVCRSVLGRNPDEKIWPFSTDGVTSAGRHGIPTLGFGPGIEAVAHTVDEWVGESDLEKAFQVYLRLPSFFDGIA